MTKQNERFVIGITGNIGAGKSTVTRALAKAGACVLDADAMTKMCIRDRHRAVTFSTKKTYK